MSNIPDQCRSEANALVQAFADVALDVGHILPAPEIDHLPQPGADVCRRRNTTPRPRQIQVRVCVDEAWYDRHVPTVEIRPALAAAPYPYDTIVSEHKHAAFHWRPVPGENVAGRECDVVAHAGVYPTAPGMPRLPPARLRPQ